MQYTDIIMGSMMMNTFSNLINMLKTEYVLLDLLIVSTIMFFIKVFDNSVITDKIISWLTNYFDWKKEENTITFMFKRGDQSIRCKSLFHYITRQKTGTSKVKHLIEDIFKKYDYRSDENKEINNIYRVDQVESFNFNDTIMGRVYKENKIDAEINGNKEYKELIHFEVYSNIESLRTIQDFIDKAKKEYLDFQKEKILENQYLITIENQINKSKDSEAFSDLKITKEEWKSNVTFDSRFFPDKNKIISNIDNFVNKEEWYKKKGLNHTLGILLYGDPGCGKTSFIKALMNHTQRHGIEVKLTDSFDFSNLKDIIFNEEIDNDIIIPQKNRIIIIEDIDATGDTVKDRKLKDQENKLAEDKFKKELSKIITDTQHPIKNNEYIKLKDNIPKYNNNNLSYLLNILDGINETPGRIIIMTTNRPEVLDEALIRPGRIDIKINFTKSIEEHIKDILYFYWKIDDSTKLKKIIFNTDLKALNNIFTPAEIIDFCRKTSNYKDTIKLMELTYKKINTN